MKLARIATEQGPRPAVADGEVWAVVEDMFASPLVRTGETVPAADAVLLAPVEPKVVLGMAHNGTPEDRLLAPQAFMKSARSVVGPGEPIVLDARHGEVKAEVEICLVVGRTARNLTAENVADHVLGWTVINDVTGVGQIPLDDKMVQVKSGDGYTPVGPWIETDLVAPFSARLTASSSSGAAVDSSVAALAWNPYEVFEYLSQHLTFGPGDVIATGAPDTAFFINVGDVVECTVEGIGTITNPVVAIG